MFASNKKCVVAVSVVTVYTEVAAIKLRRAPGFQSMINSAVQRASQSAGLSKPKSSHDENDLKLLLKPKVAVDESESTVPRESYSTVNQIKPAQLKQRYHLYTHADKLRALAENLAVTTKGLVKAQEKMWPKLARSWKENEDLTLKVPRFSQPQWCLFSNLQKIADQVKEEASALIIQERQRQASMKETDSTSQPQEWKDACAVYKTAFMDWNKFYSAFLVRQIFEGRLQDSDRDYRVMLWVQIEEIHALLAKEKEMEFDFSFRQKKLIWQSLERKVFSCPAFLCRETLVSNEDIFSDTLFDLRPKNTGSSPVRSMMRRLQEKVSLEQTESKDVERRGGPKYMLDIITRELNFIHKNFSKFNSENSMKDTISLVKDALLINNQEIEAFTCDLPEQAPVVTKSLDSTTLKAQSVEQHSPVSRSTWWSSNSINLNSMNSIYSPGTGLPVPTVEQMWDAVRNAVTDINAPSLAFLDLSGIENMLDF